MAKIGGKIVNRKRMAVHDALWEILRNVKEQTSDSALVQIRVDDGGVTVVDVVTRKILYDADLLAELIDKFLPDDPEFWVYENI